MAKCWVVNVCVFCAGFIVPDCVLFVGCYSSATTGTGVGGGVGTGGVVGGGGVGVGVGSVGGGNEEQVKPRSLRFTWSMKTTSSRDPNEIMAEIRKVTASDQQQTRDQRTSKAISL